MDEAVKHLERTIELKPEDPTINDHLGDAYWRATSQCCARTTGARFTWPTTGSATRKSAAVHNSITQPGSTNFVDCWDR
jgi:hypothetical protein